MNSAWSTSLKRCVACSINYTAFDFVSNRCYHLSPTRNQNYTGSMAYCNRAQGRLITIRNTDEFYALSFLSQICGTYCWVT